MSETDDLAVTTEAETPAQAAQPADVPPTESSPRGHSWFGGAMRIVVIAAAVVLVAGAFFTIGWFTSTRGDNDRPRTMSGVEQRTDMRQRGGPQDGTDRQGSDQWQCRPGGPGMGVPQQGQGRGQAAPGDRSQSGVPGTQQASSTEQGYLGVGLETVTPELQEQYGLSRSSGALVVTIDGRGPARQAGIRRGDIITSIDGAAVTRQEDAVDLIAKTKAGDSVTVTIERDGQSLTFQVTLAEKTASFPG